LPAQRSRRREVAGFDLAEHSGMSASRGAAMTVLPMHGPVRAEKFVRAGQRASAGKRS
jgi:hypothetical protein